MNASVKTGGRVEIRSGTTVAVSDGGSLALQGGEIRVEGRVDAHDADVSFTTELSSTTRGKLSGEIRLAPGAVIDASGRWVNERPGGQVDTQLGPVWIDGGRVAMRAQGQVAIDAGSRIDVSGGARRGDDGSLKAGDAGAIALEAADINGSNLSVDGDLLGYAVNGGQAGSLSLTSNAVSIGAGGTAPNGDNSLRTLVLAPDFFRRGGFSRYSIISNKNGVSVEPGTKLDLAVQSRVLNEISAIDRVSGSDLDDFSEITPPAGICAPGSGAGADPGPAGRAGQRGCSHQHRFGSKHPDRCGRQGGADFRYQHLHERRHRNPRGRNRSGRDAAGRNRSGVSR